MNIKNKLLLFAALCHISVHTTFGAQPPKLKNFGATCFQNATLQAIYNIQPITNFLVDNDNTYPQDTIANLYTQFVKQVRNQSPQSEEHYGLLNKLAIHGYALVGQCSLEEGCKQLQACEQHDATEFMIKLLDSLMSSNPNYRKLNPEQLLEQHPIGKIIAIQEATTVSCESINFKSTKVKPISYLNLEARTIQIKSGEPKSVPLTTLDIALTSYFTTELMDDPKNYYKLELTDEQFIQATQVQKDANGKHIPDCAIAKRLSSTSDIVIIALKRFTFSLTTGDRIKLVHPITLPAQINFKPYMTKEAAALPQPNYELIGAIHHGGTAGGGHYIAYVKNANQWYLCNDTNIQPTTWDKIQKNINLSYVAIYQKQKGGAAPIQPTDENIPPQQPAISVKQRIQEETQRQETLKAKKQQLEVARKEPLKKQEEVRTQQEQKQEPRKEEVLELPATSTDLVKALTNLQVTLDGLYASLI